MLNKTPNSVITLTILLTLVGISKPAKAFLLAQANAPEVTFTVPKELPKNTQINISASNSTNVINEGLKESFTNKYPNAKVEVSTKNSDNALGDLLAGKTDLVAIGRDLTAEEKAKGLVAVPISREKIAIVVSKDNPYDGNLTFAQFAQIFKGEITDWSEIEGEPGQIELVDLPESNDTRRSFPNYSVFQTGEFSTGSNATQLEEDSTDAMVAKLGASGISYAVAGDVIDRDDVKIVTMHQTQPDDARYPFSQPFSLVYQGEPSPGAEAFIGYAVTEEGQEQLAQRVGSVSAVSAAAIASRLANKPAQNAPNAANPPKNGAESDKVAQADLEDSGKVNTDVEDSGKPDANLENSGELDQSVEGSGELDGKVDGSGAVNPDFENSGEVNTDLEDSGKLNAQANANGKKAAEPNSEANLEIDDVKVVTPDEAKVNTDGKNDVAVGKVDGEGANPADGDADVAVPGDAKGETNAQLDADGDTDAVVPADGEVEVDVDPNAETDVVALAEGEGDTKVAKEGNNKFLWWLPLIIGIPLLGAVAYKFAGGKKRSDREPALSNVPNPGDSGGGVDGTFDPDLDGGGTRIGAGVGTTATKETGSIGNAAIATGGATIAGGAIAANNLSKKSAADVSTNDNQIELENVVAQPETDIDSPIEEIPSTPVNEFTDPKTKLQASEQSTKLQTDEVGDPETDAAASGLKNNLPTMGMGGAAVGGAAAAGYLGNRSDRDDDRDNDNYVQSDYTSEAPTRLPSEGVDTTGDAGIETTNYTSSDTASTEFPGDYVLYEEGTDTTGITDSTVEEVNTDTTAVENDSWVDGFNDDEVTRPKTSWETGTVETPETDIAGDDTFINRENDVVDDATQTGGAAIAGGAAALGGTAAAASGFFTNADSEQTTEIDNVDTDNTAVENDNWVDGFNDDEVTKPTTSWETGTVETPETDIAGDDTFINRENYVVDTDTTAVENDNWVDVDGFNDDEVTRPKTSWETGTVETPETDIAGDDTFINRENDVVDDATQTGGAAIAGGAAALGATAAAASGFFTNADSEQTTEIDNVDTDNTAVENDNWVDGFNDDEVNTFESSQTSSAEVNFNKTTASDEISIEDITFDDADDISNASLEDITFDDANETTSDASLEDITFDDANETTSRCQSRRYYF